MSLYNGIETDNVILNLDVESAFYNRDKHFNTYLSSIASRIRNDQSILEASTYGDTNAVATTFNSTQNRALSDAPTTGSWLLTRDGDAIGAITYLKDSDQVNFRINTNDSSVNTSSG